MRVCTSVWLTKLPVPALYHHRTRAGYHRSAGAPLATVQNRREGSAGVEQMYPRRLGNVVIASLGEASVTAGRGCVLARVRCSLHIHHLREYTSAQARVMVGYSSCPCLAGQIRGCNHRLRMVGLFDLSKPKSSHTRAK